MSKRFLEALMVLPMLAANANAWTLPSNVPTIANAGLQDGAAAMPTPSGPVIVYNPAVLARTSPRMREFVLAHEYGHIVLGHLAHPQSQGVPAWAQALENEADCYAARAVDDATAEEAASYFETQQGPYSVDPRHPSGNERASRIRACHARASATGDDESDDDSTGEQASCHTVTRQVTTYEPRTVPQCGVVMTAWGPRQMCVPVTVQVPVTRSVPQTTCDDTE